MTPPKKTTIIQPALLPCPCCKAPCEVEIEPARSVICEDENGDYYTEHRHAIKTYRYHAAQPAPVEQDVEPVWQALKRRVCADPKEAKRCVMVGRDDLVAALSTLTPARAEGFVGKSVQKRGGDYEFDGEIVAVIRKRSGEVRYAVEDDRGLLLIMNAKQCGLGSNDHG